MKGLIIGSDLLEQNGDVKFLEINTNTTIYNDGANLLDYDTLFNTLNVNNINEFHFIWNEMDAYYPLGEDYKFKDNLIQKCQENNITFTEYVIPVGSMTVPFIEDSDNKFILRQSYDTTALIDDTYCADKFEFFKLMSGSTYIPKTYQLDDVVGMDLFDSIDTSNSNHPNALIKARLPQYNSQLFPELHILTQESELNDLKASLPENHLLQEFVYSDENLVEGRYSIIRSIDIVYGGELDVINMGGYRQSTIIPVNLSQNELVENTTKLNQKSRYKYITKALTDKYNDYHTDGDSLIVKYDGTLKDVNTIELGDYIKSINFVDFNGNEAANFEEGKINVLQWDSNLEQSNSTLTPMSSSLEGMFSSSIDTMFIRITTIDGRTWTDTPNSTYYIEESGSLDTRFEKVNKMYVGDKLVTTDKDTNELTTLEISGLEMEYGVKTIYTLDFEPSDLFLVDVGEGDFGVMHNGCWCCWSYGSCGVYCCINQCTYCGGPQNPEKL
jgi:hypothetical protein